MGLRERVTLRKRWRNNTGNEGIDPLRQVTPTTLAELCAIVREAERDGCAVRAVGSGHSWSDVALTDGILVHPTGLNRPLDLESDLLRPGIAGVHAGTRGTGADLAGTPDTGAHHPDAQDAGGRALVRVQAGMTIAELNAYLQGRELALPNMGGFDGQTVAGVISTSTHGSGIGFGPLSDFVRSLDIVAAGGTVHRIEPRDGPSDPDAYRARYPDRQLHQDDHWFHAAVVGIGCMGLIHSVILEVGPLFYLREVRAMSTWSRVREQLARGDVLAENVHYELVFSPYPNGDGEIECLVTTRNPIPPSEYRHDHRRSRSLLMELAARFPFTPLLINLAVGLRPQISPFLLRQALKALVNDDYVNISYRVFNIGAANYLPAYSCEIGIPIDERQFHLAAVERIVEVAAQRRRLGNVYHSAPISLRFVKASDAHLSMMQGQDTMMIELIMATHTVGGTELQAAHESALHALGGRPHWGQVNTLTGSHGLVEAMYPRYQDWQAIHAELNAGGVFNSPFSKRVGISG
jgi:L-gulono-1,4-lactone dehydrogenase